MKPPIIPSSLAKALINAEAAQLKADRLSELNELLRVLYFHHESQARANTEPCSKRYNHELATRIRPFILAPEKHR